VGVGSEERGVCVCLSLSVFLRLVVMIRFFLLSARYSGKTASLLLLFFGVFSGHVERGEIKSERERYWIPLGKRHDVV